MKKYNVQAGFRPIEFEDRHMYSGVKRKSCVRRKTIRVTAVVIASALYI